MQGGCCRWWENALILDSQRLLGKFPTRLSATVVLISQLERLLTKGGLKAARQDPHYLFYHRIVIFYIYAHPKKPCHTPKYHNIRPYNPLNSCCITQSLRFIFHRRPISQTITTDSPTSLGPSACIKWLNASEKFLHLSAWT
jgi:hypothetical protein